MLKKYIKKQIENYFKKDSCLGQVGRLDTSNEFEFVHRRIENIEKDLSGLCEYLKIHKTYGTQFKDNVYTSTSCGNQFNTVN